MMEELPEIESGRFAFASSPSSNAMSTSPSMSLSPLVIDSRREICVPEENLPSLSIASLWKNELKLPTSSNTPKLCEFPINTVKLTPNRKKSPSSKLFSDEDSDTSSSPAFQIKRSFYSRSLSQPQPGTETPLQNPKRPKLFIQEEEERETSPFDELAKQPRPILKPAGGINFKLCSASTTNLTPVVKKLFVKSQSDSNLTSSCSITTALERIESNPNLIGDGSKSYILPFKQNGKHPDLKEITGDTLAALLENKEDFMPGVSFKIIDCRYPYEFDGGHIRGAYNLYTRKQIRDEFLEPKASTSTSANNFNSPAKTVEMMETSSSSREILIFHCEFSSQRGPSLCRFLRDIDRASNAMSYPFLFYPELYVLYGGYKDFYEKYAHLCSPQEYVPMTHPAHSVEYRKYKSKTKLSSCKRF